MITTVANATLYTYDPSLGTLPEDQGWIKFESLSPGQPSVSNSILNVGPTTQGGEQGWIFATPQGFDGNFGFNSKLSFEVRFDNVTGTFGPPDGGFTVGLSGQLGSYYIGFTGTQILVSGNTTVIDYDPYTDFTLYEAIVTDAGVELYINGLYKNTTPFLNSGFNTGGISFGDFTYESEYTGQIKHVKFESVPEPASLTFLAICSVALVKRRKMHNIAPGC